MAVTSDGVTMWVTVVSRGEGKRWGRVPVSGGRVAVGRKGGGVGEGCPQMYLGEVVG